MSAYQQLSTHMQSISHLQGACEMLHWDGATMMPTGGGQARASQLAELKVVIHQKQTDPRVLAWIQEAKEDASLSDWEKTNVHEIHRTFIHANALPETLVKKISEACSACELKWRDARKNNDFEGLRPYLETVVALMQEQAHIKSVALKCSPYEALLDAYEPGISTDYIDVVFAELMQDLPSLTTQILEHQSRQVKSPQAQAPFAIEKQKELGLAVMKMLGFDFEHGRLDVSLHPFCGGIASDVRITTRYREDDFAKSLMGVIHETGHALYEQGLPKAWAGQPVGLARGMSIHESQSLLMEMQAGRSRAFMEVLAPLAQKIFAQGETGWRAQELYERYTEVKRSLIRVDADEVTYPAHVILRYELEKDMIAGKIQVKDLPELWRVKMLEKVGIAPQTDADGCMQDIHWVDGLFGYFPTYTLGALTAAQLFESACDQNTSILPSIAQGHFEPLLTWLRKNVHEKASRYSSAELLTQATGRTLSPQSFIRHLKRRYLA